MKKLKLKKSRKNPSDDTGRNRKATRKLIAALEQRVSNLEKEVSIIRKTIRP